MVETVPSKDPKNFVSSEIDKSIFNEKLKVCEVKVPVRLISNFVKKFRDYHLHMPKLRCFISIEGDKEHKMVLC